MKGGFNSLDAEIGCRGHARQRTRMTSKLGRLPPTTLLTR
jgi:hypothetical protein